MMIPDFTEKAPYEAGFKVHYDQHIRPLLQDFENERVVMQKKYRRRLGIAFLIDLLLIGAAVGLIFATNGEILDIIDSPGESILAFGVVLTFPFVWAYGPVLLFKKGYKNKILPVLCQFFGNLSYQETGKYLDQETLNSGIFPSYNQQKSEDFIMGNYKDISLQINELELKHKSSKYTTLVFKGLCVVIEFPKNFHGTTLIKKDHGRLGNWLTSRSQMERVELEDPQFESVFEVYSSDQVEARYLLTTAFMERLLALAQRANKGQITSAVQGIFKANRLILAVPSHHNLFEPKHVLKSAFDLEDIHSFLGQMNDIFTMIDLLKLQRP